MNSLLLRRRPRLIVARQHVHMEPDLVAHIGRDVGSP